MLADYFRAIYFPRFRMRAIDSGGVLLITARPSNYRIIAKPGISTVILRLVVQQKDHYVNLVLVTRSIFLYYRVVFASLTTFAAMTTTKWREMKAREARLGRCCFGLWNLVPSQTRFSGGVLTRKNEYSVLII